MALDGETSAAGQPELPALLRAAVEAHRSGELEKAEALYRRVLAADPGHADANHLLGLLAHQSGRAEDAVALISKAMDRAPGIAAYHGNRAIALHALGRLDEAMAGYREAIRLDPGYAQALANLGNAHAQRFELDEAEACYRKALGLDPDLVEAHMNLGNTLAEGGRHGEAAESYRAALRIDPELAQGHYNLGNALKAQGLLDEAAASYRRVLEIDPDFTAAHMNLANAMRDLGWSHAAAESYREVLRLNPDHASANLHLGNILRDKNQLEEAIACYREALRIDPQYARVHYEIGRALRARGETEEALECYRRALDLDPDLGAAHASIADALRSQDRLEEAAASYREALAIDPDYTDARTNLGLTLQKLGRTDAAIEEFERIGGRIGKARVLECLFAAGRQAAFAETLGRAGADDPANLRAAAISAFAAQQWGLDDPYPFCPGPLDFISKENVGSALGPFDAFFPAIMEEIETAPAVWDPRGNATKGGFHTTGNLFDLGTPRISELRDVILDRIEAYRSRLKGRSNGLIARWPRRPILYGWHVKLLESGYMEPHIHTSGWVSGVIYLRMPGRLEGGEGAIAFSLHGYDYPILKPDIPVARHQPKEGDLVLFPSSLFHRTNAFRADEERHCIAFDLCPRERGG